MVRGKHLLSFGLLLLLLAGAAYALNYMYFSEDEHTVLGDVTHFWHEDTLLGPVRSNDSIAIMENPVCYDYVITSAPQFQQGPGYNPQFHGPAPVFNAPQLQLSPVASRIRSHSTEQGFYFDQGETMQAWVKIMHDTLRIRWTLLGTPFDTLDYQDVLLPDSAVVFFNAPLRVSGIVSTVLILGASGRVGLEDDIHYVHTSGPPQHRATPGHPEKFALISESEIKILNTPANGRENSAGMGFSQTNQNLTNICLNGIYVALDESFTFEQQNDPDSGYVCACQPDDRGRIYLSGSLMQKRRGYVHRSTRSSTGYRTVYRYDDDLRYWNVSPFGATPAENRMTPAEVVCLDVPPNWFCTTTLSIENQFVPIALDSFDYPAPPFLITRETDSLSWVHSFDFDFAPTALGEYRDTLRFRVGYYDQMIAVPLYGTCTATGADDDVAPYPSAFILSAYPNPFNYSTQLSFTLETAGLVSVDLYDVLGQHVTTLFNGFAPAGVQQLTVDGRRLTSGVYFVHLMTPSRQHTIKLLLLK